LKQQNQKLKIEFLNLKTKVENSLRALRPKQAEQKKILQPPKSSQPGIFSIKCKL